MNVNKSGIYRVKRSGYPYTSPVVTGNNEDECWDEFNALNIQSKYSDKTEFKFFEHVPTIDLNYQYCSDIGYDYNGNTDCYSHGCDEEGICRCFTIGEARVTKLDINGVREWIVREIDGKKDQYKIREENISKVLGEVNIKEYFVDRLLSIYKLFNKENWDVIWSGSYYGDEIEGIYPSLQTKFAMDLAKYDLDPNYLIELLLEREYGYVREDLKNLNWKIEVVDRDKIVLPQREHANNIPIIYDYHDDRYKLPRGIVTEENGYYKVVDGYHRIGNTNLDVVEVIVGYKKES